jgi:hypothetical protein
MTGEGFAFGNIRIWIQWIPAFAGMTEGEQWIPGLSIKGRDGIPTFTGI